MQVIKIDPLNQIVSNIYIDDTLEDIYKQLECEIFTCPIILDNRDTLYIDDEGLLINDENYKGCFYFGDFEQPLFGNGLVIGTTIEGDNADVSSSIETIKKIIKFVPEETGRYFLNNFRKIDHFKVYTL